MRGGVWVVHDNTIRGYGSSPTNPMTNQRTVSSYVNYGPADGLNEKWDVNQPGGPFFTGLAASANAYNAITGKARRWPQPELDSR